MRLWSVFFAFVANGSLQFSVGISLALGVAFVVFLLAFTQGDLAFDEVVFPIQAQGYAGITFLLHGAEQLAQFALVQKQLPGSSRVGDDVRAGGGQRRNVATDQPSFTIFEQHVAVDQLGFAGA